MTKFNFSTKREEVEKQYNLGKGQYFKPKNGTNKVRLVSKCLEHPGEFKGKPTFKWLCQILDLTDNKVKPYFMPHTVYTQIESLQLDPDWAFDEVPMPYSINIQTSGAGTLEAKYHVQGSPQKILLTLEQQQAINDAPSIEDLQKKVYEADKGEGNLVTKEQAAEQMSDIDVSDIPF